MARIGFDINNEFLPSFDKFNSLVNQRKMFLKLFNQEVACELKFSKDELKACNKETLFNIFAKKILKNLKFDVYISSPLNTIDTKKSNKINRFLNQLNKRSSISFKNFDIKNSLEEANIDVSLKLIDILEECNYSLYLDGEKTFKNFVSNKILKGGEDREVYINKDSIDIKSEKHLFNTKIFTFWEFLDSEDLKIDKHIEKAVECINTTEFKQVYLVYPKNENFNKHIPIKCDEIAGSDYEIKLIPYSLRSTLR